MAFAWQLIGTRAKMTRKCVWAAGVGAEGMGKGTIDVASRLSAGQARELLTWATKIELRGLQAWAVMEWREGNVDTARQLLETGSRADPHHLHIWQAWGVLEHREGNLNRAREMFQQAVWAQPKGKDVAIVWQVRGLASLCIWHFQLGSGIGQWPHTCAVSANIVNLGGVRAGARAVACGCLRSRLRCGPCLLLVQLMFLGIPSGAMMLLVLACVSVVIRLGAGALIRLCV